MSLGVLSDPSVPFNVLLDAIRYAETGHLSPAASLTAPAMQMLSALISF